MLLWARSSSGLFIKLNQEVHFPCPKGLLSSYSAVPKMSVSAKKELGMGSLHTQTAARVMQAIPGQALPFPCK